MKLTAADEVTIKFGRVQPVRRSSGKRRGKVVGMNVFGEKVEDRAVFWAISCAGRRDPANVDVSTPRSR